MKKFLIQLSLFGLAFLIFDRLFIFFIDRSPETEIDKRLELLINGKINKDVIIIGSSRGARDIIAGQLEKEIRLSAYNLSYPGSDIEFHDFLLKTLVKFNKPPKIVILTVDDPSELIAEKSIGYRLDRLYPLVKYKYIRQELETRYEKNILLDNLLMLYRINKSNFDLKKKAFTSMDTMLACGSMPISFQRKDREFVYEQDNKIYDTTKELTTKLNSFNEFVNTCKSYNIDLIIAFPPNFKSYNKTFENRIEQLTKNKAHYYVYDTLNPIYANKDSYFDESHLQTKSAAIFTNEFSLFLKRKHFKLELSCVFL